MRRSTAALALLVALASAGGCDEPAAPPGGGGPPIAVTPLPPPVVDRARPFAYLRDGAVVVSESGRERELALAGEVSSFAWGASGDELYAARGLEIVAVPLAGGAVRAVATISDPANTRVAALELAVTNDRLVAETAGEQGPEMYVDSRTFEVALASGRVGEISPEDADRLRGRAPRRDDEAERRLVSPSGAHTLVVEEGAAGGSLGAANRLLVTDETAPPRVLVEIAALPPAPEGHEYTGEFLAAEWAAGLETVLFIPVSICGDFCYGPLFAIEPDGTRLRRLAAETGALPRGANGTRVLVEEAGEEGPVVALVDLASDERRAIGRGAMARWAPPVSAPSHAS